MKLSSSMVLCLALCLLALTPVVVNATCGNIGQACCSGLCYAGMFCDKNSGNTCQRNCGGIGQYCCSNSASGGCNTYGTFCEKGYGALLGQNFCVPNCGQKGQSCCRNSWCAGGLYCNATVGCASCPKVNGVVKCPSNNNSPCGSAGQTCCLQDSCAAGLFCDTTSYPGTKSCRPYCGAAGQKCCPVKSTGYDGCNSNQGIFCSADTGLCTYNCGSYVGQLCCPNGSCNGGLRCLNAKCAK